MHELVVFGVGNLGLLFAEAALQCSARVMPIRRGDDAKGRIEFTPANTPILLAVGEAELADSVQQIPGDRRDDVILVQNEIFPHHLNEIGLRSPTVATVWSAKKKNVALMPGASTRVFGKHAQVVQSWHEILALECRVLDSESELHRAMVSKYAFILTINTLGLQENRTLGEWLMNDADVDHVRAVAKDAFRLGQAHLGQDVDEHDVLRDVFEGMNSLIDMPSRGRMAEMRVRSATDDAQRFGFELSTIGSI